MRAEAAFPSDISNAGAAATPPNDGGTPGKAVFTDIQPTPPRSQYKAKSGGMALGHIDVHPLKVYGNRGDRRQSEGTHVWLQPKDDGDWVHRAGGTLLTGQTTSSAPVVLDPDLVDVLRRAGREGIGRVVVKVIWFDPDASVRGWQTWVIDEYRTLVKGSNGPVHAVRHVCGGGLVMVDWSGGTSHRRHDGEHRRPGRRGTLRQAPSWRPTSSCARSAGQGIPAEVETDVPVVRRARSAGGSPSRTRWIRGPGRSRRTCAGRCHGPALGLPSACQRRLSAPH